ncbi:MAG TPA: hypothetical protein PKD61_18195 [Polyangiaceae bacterium]|nr:hypothetical protein [Polyangiaceae bacterium]
MPAPTSWSLQHGRSLLQQIDLGKEQFFNQRAEFELADAAAVIVGGIIGERGDSEDSWRTAVWAVRVVLRSRDADACAHLERSEAPHEADGSEPDVGADAAAGAGYRGAQPRHARQLHSVAAVLPELEKASVFVGDHSDEFVAHRIAIALARAFGVPLIDASSDVPALCWPNELGMPLTDQLALGIAVVPDDPGAPPAGIRCTEDNGLDVRWYRPVDLPFALAVLIAGLILGGALVAVTAIVNDVAQREIFWAPGWTMLVAVLVTALLIYLLPSEYLWNQLLVSRQELEFRKGPHRWAALRVPTSEVEALRTTRPGPEGFFHLEALRVATKSRVVVRAMPMTHSRWIAARVTRYLAKRDATG